MNRLNSSMIVLCVLLALSFSGHAELRDQGLNSIIQIIDKAIDDINGASTGKQGTEADSAVLDNARAAILNLSKTLGSLSYSRLQCGEADVLSEFTQRVQKMPEASRDAMRDAFQSGFEKTASETELISEDECARLTKARIRSETGDFANLVEEEAEQKQPTNQEAAAEPELSTDEPGLRHSRIAELVGQLAYKHKICSGDQVFTRDFNEFIQSVPAEFREDVKTSYWKGYNHGKRLNPGLSRDDC